VCVCVLVCVCLCVSVCVSVCVCVWQEADVFLAQLGQSLPVDIMPGPNDPANHSLPQQVLHASKRALSCCVYSPLSCTPGSLSSTLLFSLFLSLSLSLFLSFFLSPSLCLSSFRSFFALLSHRTPMQALQRCLFPLSGVYTNVRGTTNPYECAIDDVRCVPVLSPLLSPGSISQRRVCGTTNP
jgi:hypothetical protein